MGVLNVTPDSFSDGGRYADAEAAVAHGLRLVAGGATWLDVGGESTRPGADPVDEAEELRRVLPVIRRLQEETEASVSIDTMKPAVARAAVEAGACMWNDVNALRAPGALEAAADLGCDVVLMHMKGEPKTMQDSPEYGDVVAEVEAWLLERVDAAIIAGVDPKKIWLDPGIGFGKRIQHNLALLANLDRLADYGFPVMLGVSRKRTVRALDPSAVDPLDRLGGSLAIHLFGAAKGIKAIRTHDVRETVQALKVWSALDAADDASHAYGHG
ncbi:MAG: dihydropteroate synthase [Caulobacteraceae bacterium]|nr:dihydropteroate synthase [Caulobacter sp.]